MPRGTALTVHGILQSKVCNGGPSIKDVGRGGVVGWGVGILGKGSKFIEICPRIEVKKCPHKGGRSKTRKMTDVFYGWSLCNPRTYLHAVNGSVNYPLIFFARPIIQALLVFSNLCCFHWLGHGLLNIWTELLYLTFPHEADLLTLIMSHKLTQYL